MSKKIHHPRVRSKGPKGPFAHFLLLLSFYYKKISTYFAYTILSFMFVAILVNVILRYVFGSGIDWAYEIHSLLLPWLIASGIVIATAHNRNIIISILPDQLSKTNKKNFLQFVEVLVIIISVVVIYYSPPILRAAQYQSLSTLNIKQFWGYLSLIYAFVGMIVISLEKIIVGFKDYENDDHRSLS
jgi:TRAP-type C4-dicarboxylate transport system permease small subunit